MAVNVELFDDLDAVERDAHGALDREHQPSLFDRLSWYRLIAEHDQAARPIVARARNGTATAWLFLSATPREVRGLTNWYSLRYGSVHIGSEQIRSNLLFELASELKPGLPRIEFGPIEQGNSLPSAFRASGWYVDVQPMTMSWDVALNGRDFEAYWTDRPSRLRNTARRKAKAAGLDITIHDHFDEAAWADYDAIYQASWKPREGAMAMLEALARAEGAAGTLRFGIASKDGQPVAAQLWLVEGGEATIHKLAYREDAKALSPGTVLSVEMFRQAIDVDKVTRIDFGTGDDPYKRDWMERRTQLYRLTAFNPATVAGLAGAARARASALVRSVRSR
jgi:hypothetical protein